MSNMSKVLADKREPGRKPKPHEWAKLSAADKAEYTKHHLSLEEWNEAEEKVRNCLVKLMMAHPFFGGMIVMMAGHRVWVEQEERMDFKTMATDGKRLYIWPQFALYLNKKEITGVLMHELMHNILQHPARGMGYHPRLANMAMDYTVNLLVNDAALEAIGIDGSKTPMNPEFYDRVDWYVPVDAKIIDPKNPQDNFGLCIDESFRNQHGDPLQWEQVYELLLQRLPQQLQHKIRGGGHPQPGDQPGDGEGCGEGGGELTQEELERALGHKLLDDHRMWSPKYRPKDQDGSVNRDKYDINIAKDWYRGAEARIKGEMRGHIPAGIMRRIQGYLETPTPWPELLDAFCEPVPTNTTWAPPDVRHVDPLPWYEVERELKYIMLGFDTSGSMSDLDIGTSIQDALGIIRSYPGTKGKAIFWDAVVENVVDLEDFKERPEDGVKGGGGTCIRPQFDWVRDHDLEDKVQVFVVFTDGYVDWDSVNPDELPYPVIWVITNNHVNPPEHEKYKTTRLKVRN